MTQAHEHLAAIIPQKGGPLSVLPRPTPEPGPNDILIEVKAIAVNPVDYYQRDMGIPNVPSYPAVVGSDVAGIVVKTGSAVPSDAPTPGTRVTTFASSYYQEGNQDYGGFQEYVLAPWEGVAPLPDHLTFEDGAILPLAVLTAWSGWYTIDLPHETKFTAEDKQAVLIWGGSSSMGTMAIQSAKLMGFTVYTTASKQHHEYLKTLGADRTFNYKADDVVSQIVTAANEDGVTLHNAYIAVPGSLEPTLEVLKQLKGDAIAKIAHAPVLVPGAPTEAGIVAKFVSPPMDPTARAEHIFKSFGVWLAEGLESGTIVPSPHIQIVEGGLEGLNQALDILKAGVSGTKLVVKV